MNDKERQSAADMKEAKKMPNNKAVLLSIRPEWCDKILNGKKTVEIRKSCPAHGTPFKVYIYCTKAQSKIGWLRIVPGKGWLRLDSAVIGEFTCKKITGLTHVGETGNWEPASLYVMAPGLYYKPADELLKAACMSKETAEKYLKGRDGCGWHISDLKIYDNPKPLSCFSKHGFSSLFGTSVCGNEDCKYYEPSGDRMVPPTCGLNGYCSLHRPPQSWCYVEELKDETILPVLLQRLSER